MEKTQNPYGLSAVIKKSFDFFVKNFKVLIGALLMPTVFEVVGISLALAPSISLSQNPSGANTSYLIFILLGAIVGLVLFCYGFWRFLLAVYAINIMASDYDSDGVIKDYTYYEQIVDKRKGEYVRMLLWVMLYSLIVSIVLIVCSFLGGAIAALNKIIGIFIVAVGIIFSFAFFVRVSIATPVFALEENIEPKNIIKRCLDITLDKFLITFGYIFILGLISIVLQLAISLIALPVTLILASNKALSQIWDMVVAFVNTLLITPFYLAYMVYLYKKLIK